MPKFKNISIRMKSGKKRIQRVQVLANGKFKFVKNKGSSKAKPAKKRVKNTTKRTPVKNKSKTRRTNNMGKRKSSKKSSGSTGGLMNSIKRIAKPAAVGLGAVSLLGLIAPGLAQNKLISTGAAFLIGGPVAGGTALLTSPGGLNLGGLLGGGGGSDGGGLA